MRTSLGFKWLFEGCIVKAACFTEGKPKPSREPIPKENISSEELNNLRLFIERMKPITADGSRVQYFNNNVIYTVYF